MKKSEKRPIREGMIVAFMQNAWFPEHITHYHRELYQTDQAFHRVVLGKTMSGNRLKQAFGDKYYNLIWWDNAGPPAIGSSEIATPIDIKHVDKVINDHDPLLILTFGRKAEEAVSRAVNSVDKTVMNCHHPNARFKTQEDLLRFALRVIQWLREVNPSFLTFDSTP